MRNKMQFGTSLVPKPVEQSFPWLDDRPGPGAMHHGVYTPKIELQKEGGQKTTIPLCGFPFPPTRKPRGTV